MPVYSYQATDKSGKLIDGRYFAVDPMAATDALQRLGLRVEHLKPVSIGFDPVPVSYGGREDPLYRWQTEETIVVPYLMRKQGLRLTLVDQAEIMRQLATMSKARMSLSESLDTIGRLTRNKAKKEVAGTLLRHALAGVPLSASMARYPEVFAPITIEHVRLGEKLEGYELGLANAAQYLEKDIVLQEGVKRLGWYPAGIFACLTGLCLFFNFMLSKSVWEPLKNPVVFLLFLYPIVMWALHMRVFFAHRGARHDYGKWVMKLPMLAAILKGLARAKFSRCLASMYAAGVPISTAVETAGECSGSRDLTYMTEHSARSLREGRPIAESLYRTGLFPEEYLQVTHTGEITGQLDELLVKYADLEEDEALTSSIRYLWITFIRATLFLAIYFFVVFVLMGLSLQRAQ